MALNNLQWSICHKIKPNPTHGNGGMATYTDQTSGKHAFTYLHVACQSLNIVVSPCDSIKSCIWAALFWRALLAYMERYCNAVVRLWGTALHGKILCSCHIYIYIYICIYSKILFLNNFFPACTSSYSLYKRIWLVIVFDIILFAPPLMAPAEAISTWGRIQYLPKFLPSKSQMTHMKNWTD